MAGVSGPWVDRIDAAGERMLKEAMMERGLTTGSGKVARTIADLEASGDIRGEHVAEAIGYRKLDRKL
jgi:magnesium chelatase family protein